LFVKEQEFFYSLPPQVQLFFFYYKCCFGEFFCDSPGWHYIVYWRHIKEDINLQNIEKTLNNA